ncbi:3'(2'),5'-bisphosphate nucleotidase [Sporothrix epigloea]|uniref:3'(2'),5'-bisphosphate nucleotidase n=1 Tax=Sporothrix epigloea TaxID=1892477 RepID=A0ABP0DRC4_9PEZI
MHRLESDEQQDANTVDPQTVSNLPPHSARHLSFRSILGLSLLTLAFAIFLARPQTLTTLASASSRHHFSRLPAITRAFTAAFPTMASTAYAKELQVAQLAVQRAAILTKKVFHEKAKGTVSKDDKSPVTIGDFGAQALIISALRHTFPTDEIVAEEEADQLRVDAALRDTIWSFVKDTNLDDASAENVLGGPIPTVDTMLDLLDQGKSAGGRSGRIWTIDPIDGTKGFLRGGQYAVCVGLIVDGDVQVGVLGCPNLPTDDATKLTIDVGANQTDKGNSTGVLFSAVKGEGAYSRPLTTGAVQPAHRISMNSAFSSDGKDLSGASFCESVEAGHSNQSDSAQIAQILGITKPSVRMDSQAKYGSIARGAGDIYLRLPVSATYQEKIWDHAAGDLIVREAGGLVTDTLGRPLDFGHGRTLAENKGVVAAPAAIHATVLSAVQTVLKVSSI